MTFTEFKKLIQPLAVQLGAEWDLPSWRLYHKAVDSVPMPLLTSAVEKAAETRTKFPSAAQLREIAELIRREVIKANPYLGCAECEMQIGWRTLKTESGQPTVSRCSCLVRHRDKLARLGVTPEPIALPAASDQELLPVGD